MVSEKAIVDMFKGIIKATYDNPTSYKPGLLAVSGLTYGVNPEKKTLTFMNFIDNEGKVTSDTNVYGLVRNHWYQITLDNLNGLGTPVYDPDKIIKTEKPDTDESYIAAKINVLAWNIKTQNVTLE